MTEPTMVVRIPATFFYDHQSRDLPVGRVVRENKRYVHVRVTRTEWAEWRSDAGHYSTFQGDDYRQNRAVCDSAKRTVIAIPWKFTADAAGMGGRISDWTADNVEAAD